MKGFYRVMLRSPGEFEQFRFDDIDRKGELKKLVGKRPGGSWADQAILVSKYAAHVEEGELVADTWEAQEVIAPVSPAVHVGENVFQGTSKKRRKKEYG